MPAAPLLAMLSQAALELLRVLLRERPATVSELATLTGRGQPNVSRSLRLRARHGLVRLVQDGGDVRPEPNAASVRVDLTTGTYQAMPDGGGDH